MGNARHGRLPHNKKWNAIVAMIIDGEDAAQISGATLEAAGNRMQDDEGAAILAETVYFLACIAEAPNAEDYVEQLQRLGIRCDSRPDTTELLALVSEALDRRYRHRDVNSDLADIAGTSAIHALATLLSKHEDNLFSSTPEDTQAHLNKLATPRQFGRLARHFFAELSRRHLQFFISRETPSHVGRHRRFGDQGELRTFNESLRTHCWQASLTVEKFASDWYSKHRHQGNLTRGSALGFASMAAEKITAVLKGWEHSP